MKAQHVDDPFPSPVYCYYHYYLFAIIFSIITITKTFFNSTVFCNNEYDRNLIVLILLGNIFKLVVNTTVHFCMMISQITFKNYVCIIM